MTENKIDIRHLSDLAKLKLSETESAAVEHDLNRIIDMVDLMQSIDTEGVTPLAHPLDSHARLRPDQVTEEDDRERYQRGAPATEEGLYLVPRVVE
jgi:aspartyl-tRNA(Asn)/glutamyl-tRNA(Gln) amidotransferase subunit C